MVEARGRQTERAGGTGRQMHLWSRVFLPEPARCRLFFFPLDKSLLGDECTQTGLWRSFPDQSPLSSLGYVMVSPEPHLPLALELKLSVTAHPGGLLGGKGLVACG